MKIIGISRLTSTSSIQNPNASSAKVQAKKCNRVSTKRNCSEALSESVSPVPHPHNSTLDYNDDASSKSSPSPAVTRKRRRVSIGCWRPSSHFCPNAPHNNPVEQDDDASSISSPVAAPPQKQRCVSCSSLDTLDVFSEDVESDILYQEAEPAEQVSNCISHIALF